MRRVRILASILLTTSIVCCSSFKCNADVKSNNQSPKVIIEMGAGDVPSDIIEELIKENPEAGEIAITDYEDTAEDMGTQDLKKSDISKRERPFSKG